MDNKFLVACMIVKNEEKMLPYSIGSIYDYMDEIVVIDHESTDNTIAVLKKLDTKNKIRIVTRKWNNNYSDARNAYLDYIKTNIYPKHKTNLYYFVLDADEIYYEDKMATLREILLDNPDAESFRMNFYVFRGDPNHLDRNCPVDGRINAFRFFPDIRYMNAIHEVPVHMNSKRPVYGHALEDEKYGVRQLPGFWYVHYSWTDLERCKLKAENYIKHYEMNGREYDKADTKQRLVEIDKWVIDHQIKFNAPLPNVFTELGLLPKQTPTSGQMEWPLSAFTIVKNAIKYDYPVIESIKSILPIVDEFVINVGELEPGEEDDGTFELLQRHFKGDPRVKIFKSQWEKRDQGTAFLRNQTNKAMHVCRNKVCLYVQADEVYHEDDLLEVKKCADSLYERNDIVAYSFDWLHFYGSKNTINPKAYPKEIRLVKKDYCESVGDAYTFGPTFAKGTVIMQYPQLYAESRARVFHYGWLREPEKMLSKLQSFDKFYHNDKEWNEMHKNDPADGKYVYNAEVQPFTGTHPKVMEDRLKE